MKHFILLGTVFLTPVLLFFILAEFIIGIFPNSYKDKELGIKNSCEEINTMVLGSSATLMGILPSEINDSCYNMANVSQTLEYDYLVLQSYRKQLPSLKTIILSVDDWNLFYDNNGDYARSTYYNRYMGIRGKQFDFLNMLEISNPMMFTEKLKVIIKNKGESGIDSKGWNSDYSESAPSEDVLYESSMGALIDHFCRDYSNVIENKKYLDLICDLCKKCKISIIAIDVPKWNTYNKGVPVQKTDSIKSVMSYLINKYDVKYKNYSEDNRFSKDDFHDGNHLSKKGAIKFSRILKKDFNL